MGVLDTFYILFKTDADKAAAEIAGVETASVAAEAGLLKADAAVAALGGSFVTLAVQLAAPILAFASLGGAISTALSRVNEVDDIGDAAFKLRSTTQEYDAISRAAKAAGVGAADFQANLAMFSDKLNDAAARPDGPNAKNFAKWGIHFRDAKGEALGAVDGILALSKSLEKVPQAEALGRLRRLGIRDSDTIGFIMQGKKALEEQIQTQKESGVVTDEQIQIAGDYQIAVGKTNNVLDTFSNRMVEAIIPALTAGLNKFSEFFGWLLDHEALVKGFFIGIAAVVTAVFLPAMLEAAAAVLAATWPFLLIAAAIAAIGTAAALAYEDLTAYFNGQNSLIGELIKKYQWLIDEVKDAWAKIVNAVSQAWEEIQPVLAAVANGAKSILDGYIAIYQPLYDAFKNLFSALGDLAEATKDRILADIAALLPGWKQNFEDMKTSFGDAFADMITKIQPWIDAVRTAAGVVKDIFETLANIIKAIWGGVIEGIANGIKSVADGIRSLAGITASGGGGAPVPADNAGRAGTTIGGMFGINRAGSGDAGLGSQTPAGIAANQNTRNTTNTVNVGAVNVQTAAPDAQGMAAAARSALQGELRNTASHFDDGVDR